MYDVKGNLISCSICNVRDNNPKIAYKEVVSHQECFEQEYDIEIKYDYIRGKYITEWHI